MARDSRDLEKKSDRRAELFAATPRLDTLEAMLTLAHRDGLSFLVMELMAGVAGGRAQGRRRRETARASAGGPRAGFME